MSGNVILVARVKLTITVLVTHEHCPSTANGGHLRLGYQLSNVSSLYNLCGAR